jgi:hypothetical protein
VEGEQPRPYLHSPFNEAAGRFSPETNPHWVAYQSDEPAGMKFLSPVFRNRDAGYRPAAADLRNGEQTGANCSISRRTTN